MRAASRRKGRVWRTRGAFALSQEDTMSLVGPSIILVGVAALVVALVVALIVVGVIALTRRGGR